jgi:energy-coupling factor transporter transmembrane protein EcfT
LFFGVLALIMIGVKDQNDRRDSWHHGGWTIKTVIWLLLIVLAFFIPDAVMLAYGMLYNLTFTLLIPCEIDD